MITFRNTREQRHLTQEQPAAAAEVRGGHRSLCALFIRGQ